MNQISENLFNAIDIIIQERLKDLPFDKTILGTIVEVIKDKNDNILFYMVSYQGITFPAYTNLTGLDKGNSVYVLIPQNDTTNKRFIIGKL